MQNVTVAVPHTASLPGLKGAVTVVTGAVGNLGLAVARAFQGVGARTVLVDRSTDRIAETYPRLAESPDHMIAPGVDLSDPESVEELVRRTVARFGRVDVLVNTVGAFRGGKPVHEEPLETWDFLLDVNLRTALLTSRAVIPAMLAQGRGRIVNVISRNAFAGAGNYAAYSAAKAALLRLTESLAEETRRSGLNVNCVVPGTIDTPQNRQAMPQADENKFVPPEAIADVILFLASDLARAVSGAAVPVYGKG